MASPKPRRKRADVPAAGKIGAAGKLAAGADWVQESIVGSRFTGRYRLDGEGQVIPTITGRAYVVGEATLIRDPAGPFADGIR